MNCCKSGSSFLLKGVKILSEFEKEVRVSMRLVGGTDITDDQGRDLLLKKAATVANLPTQGESDGDIYLVLDEDTIPMGSVVTILGSACYKCKRFYNLCMSYNHSLYIAIITQVFLYAQKACRTF